MTSNLAALHLAAEYGLSGESSLALHVNLLKMTFTSLDDLQKLSDKNFKSSQDMNTKLLNMRTTFKTQYENLQKRKADASEPAGEAKPSKTMTI